MVGVQFFKKTTENLEEWKASAMRALDILQMLTLWTQEQVSFFRSYITSQVAYIPRDDMTFFAANVQKLQENHELLALYKQKIADLSGADVQTCFELVSRLHDVVEEWEQQQHNLRLQEQKKQHLMQAYEQEQQEKAASLTALEQQLENL